MSHSRPTLRLAVTALLATLMGIGCGKETPRAAGPHTPGAPVILISIDTLRADRLPAYGYTAGSTPSIDRFRSDAILFENAYSHCPLTLPSHLSMLTGLLPPEHGVRNNLGFTFQPDRHPTIPDLLKARGYATAGMVSSFVLRRETGLAEIFDVYDASVTPTPGLPVGEYVRDGSQTARVARDWVDRQGDSPFFLFLHLYEPHAPWTPPEAFRGRGHDAYDDEIAYADAIVGELLDHLRATGLYDKSLIILTSDHGEGLGDHGELQHGILLYREALHVPLLLKLPKNERSGTAVAAPAQLIDLLPTVTSLVGAQTPSGLSGHSLLDLPVSRSIYSETLYPQLQLGWSALQSITDERYHYIESPAPELFDITTDPRELTNVISDQRRVAAARRKEVTAFSTVIDEIEDVDPETAKKLAALGYVGSTSAGANANAPDPKSAIKELGRIEEGFALAGERRFDEAGTVLSSVVREHPGMIDVWIKLGEVYSESNRLDDATAAYREAITRSARLSPDLVLAAADVHLRNGDFAQARSHAELALDKDPARAHEMLARIALVRGNLDEAAREASIAIERGGEFLVAPRLVYAEILQKQGRFDSALQVIADVEKTSAARGLGPVYSLEFLRGDTYAQMGNPEQAAAAYEKEIAAFPGHRQAYAKLAVVHFLQQRRDRMLATLERLVAANPDRQSFELAARTLEVLGEPDAASKFRRRAR